MNKNDPIQFILYHLPPFVVYDGHEFEFMLINDGGTECRIVYSPINDLPDLWYNDLLKCRCSFLYLCSNIKNARDLEIALDDCNDFLLRHNLKTFLNKKKQ